jgi:hypothetical protein
LELSHTERKYLTFPPRHAARCWGREYTYNINASV